MIRRYKNTDADAAVTSWRAASELAHPFLTQDFLDKEADNVRNVYPAHAKIWVKEVEGQVIGFLAMLDNEIGGLFLDPKYHGCGYGRDFVDLAVAENGLVTVEVFRDNAIGRKFYDGYGFQKTGEYKHEPSGHMTLQMAFEPESN